jgi:hypothetical protein
MIACIGSMTQDSDLYLRRCLTHIALLDAEAKCEV